MLIRERNIVGIPVMGSDPRSPDRFATALRVQGRFPVGQAIGQRQLRNDRLVHVRRVVRRHPEDGAVVDEQGFVFVPRGKVDPNRRDASNIAVLRLVKRLIK